MLCLWWTHDDINADMMFGHGGRPDASVLKFFDELQRHRAHPDSIYGPLVVVPFPDVSSGQFASGAPGTVRRGISVLRDPSKLQQFVWCRSRGCVCVGGGLRRHIITILHYCPAAIRIITAVAIAWNHVWNSQLVEFIGGVFCNRSFCGVHKVSKEAFQRG